MRDQPNTCVLHYTLKSGPRIITPLNKKSPFNPSFPFYSLSTNDLRTGTVLKPHSTQRADKLSSKTGVIHYLRVSSACVKLRESRNFEIISVHYIIRRVKSVRALVSRQGIPRFLSTLSFCSVSSFFITLSINYFLSHHVSRTLSIPSTVRPTKKESVVTSLFNQFSYFSLH